MSSYSEMVTKTDFLQNIFFYDPQMKESKTGLQWHEGKLMMTGFSFLLTTQGSRTFSVTISLKRGVSFVFD